jgi:flagellar biogenesis protein FliO
MPALSATALLAAADPSMTSTLLRVAIVFVLLAATMKVMARVTGRRGAPRRAGRTVGMRRRSASRPIEIVDRQALNRSASIAIVDVDGRRLALGITDQNVRLLADLSVASGDEPVDIDLRDVPDPGAEPAPSLRALADTLRERPGR